MLDCPLFAKRSDVAKAGLLKYGSVAWKEAVFSPATEPGYAAKKIPVLFRKHIPDFGFSFRLALNELDEFAFNIAHAVISLFSKRDGLLKEAVVAKLRPRRKRVSAEITPQVFLQPRPR